MNVFRVELLVLDGDGIGGKAIMNEIENTRYGNRCISPQVMSIQGADIGEWRDDHPLNSRSKSEAEFRRLFPQR
jgi:hypothetical protein